MELCPRQCTVCPDAMGMTDTGNGTQLQEHARTCTLALRYSDESQQSQFKRRGVRRIRNENEIEVK